MCSKASTFSLVGYAVVVVQFIVYKICQDCHLMALFTAELGVCLSLCQCGVSLGHLVSFSLSLKKGTPTTHPGIDSRSTATLTIIKQLLKMNEWMYYI